ncbi:MAG TPA: DUF6498-containing protein [Armatimonadota bacterium]
MTNSTAQQIEDVLVPMPIRQTLSFICLLVGTVMPLIGVLFFGWDLLTVMLIYWAENLVIGLYNVAKMTAVLGWGEESSTPEGSILDIPFFVVHYGAFCFVHGGFLAPIISHTHEHAAGLLAGQITAHPWTGPALALIMLIVGHGTAFVDHFLRNSEYQRVSTHTLLFQPSGRVVLLHVTLLFGALLIVVTGKKVAMLALLVLLKLMLDLVLFRKQLATLSVKRSVTSTSVGSRRK